MFEAMMIAAMELCVGSVAYDACTHWMYDCQLNQMVAAEAWTFEDGAERCIETLPEEFDRWEMREP